ncbi:MAG: D-alanyl-D-alanine carboxypeptidase [Desulfobacteraceae bacterium]|nr:D-alanyl-D-alanine carboxypeptidase [Desulfobacteraceae bacterium]
MKLPFIFTAALAALIILFNPVAALCDNWEDLDSMPGKQVGMMVMGPENEILFAKNPDKSLIPASTLKILTALTAFYHLGPDFRFKTEFYLDQKNNLFIKGYGDPLLVSEQVEKTAGILAVKAANINDIVLDDSYFAPDIKIPGSRGDSDQPYDAPVGALCVNFNTVNLKKVNGRYISAEPQTPLLPLVIKKLEKRDIPDERVLLSSKNSENLLYAGQLFKHFLEARGVKVSGQIRPGRDVAEKHRLVYRHNSCFALREVVAQLMEFSNNFVANQLLLTAGAEAYGPPATLEKGLRAMRRYADQELKISPVLAEGSGISRQNRMSARMFMPVLGEFAPYYRLLPEENGIYCKTGTLNGVSTRAGYIEKNGDIFRFAVLINTSGRDAGAAAKKIADILR